jgi:hypothetical protein
MTTAEAVRRVGLGLPRTYERLVRGLWKLKVGQLVYVAFSADEASMGFGFPKLERDALVASAPDVFFLPPVSDLRYQWVCVHLDRLADDEMRELVTDAWRMCVPAMLHDLPELPSPVARAWHLVEQRDWDAVRPLLHPYLRWQDGGTALRGRNTVLAHLRDQPTPRPPHAAEIRDDQVYRWVRL